MPYVCQLCGSHQPGQSATGVCPAHPSVATVTTSTPVSPALWEALRAAIDDFLAEDELPPAPVDGQAAMLVVDLAKKARVLCDAARAVLQAYGS